MASNEARGPHADSAGEALEDALGRLEERLDRASQAAERLLADAAERVTGGSRSDTPPPAGWQPPGPERDASSPLLGADADLVLGLFGAVRDRIPPDLQQRLAEAIREVLLALRALIDWYLERTERRPTGPAEVQDIPIL